MPANAKESPLASDDVDAALDKLTDSFGDAAEGPPGESEVSETGARGASTEGEGPPGPPPRVRPLSAADTQEVSFDSVLQRTAQPARSSVSGPTDKVEYLREKLRTAEAQIARLRSAWEQRERQMQHVAATAQQESRRADEATSRLDKVNTFIETKKKELHAYAHKVRLAINETSASEQQLRQQMQDLEQALSEAQRQISVRDDAIIRLNRVVDDLKARLGEQDHELELLREDLYAEQEETDRLKMALRAEVAKTRSPESRRPTRRRY